MTDDITRGLSLLAGEVAPAPVDTGAVIGKARARARNRRASAATALAVAATVTLVISLTDRHMSAPPADRAERLTQELTEVQDDVAPANWRLLPAGTPGPLDASLAGAKPLSFACRGYGDPLCQAVGHFQRGEDRLSVAVQVAGTGGPMIDGSDAEVVALPDGTSAIAATTGSTFMIGFLDVLSMDEAYPALRTQLLSARRPDGTSVIVNVAYTGHESEPPFTHEQLLRFATAFTY
jgi:hypothetical protein